MAKTFGKLKVNDEVYVIDNNRMKVGKISDRPSFEYAFIEIDGWMYSIPADVTSFYDEILGDIYSDFNEATKAIKE